MYKCIQEKNTQYLNENNQQKLQSICFKTMQSYTVNKYFLPSKSTSITLSNEI